MVIPVFTKVENVALKEDWLFIYMKILHIQLLHFRNDPTYGKVNLYKFLEMNCHINYYSVMCTDLQEISYKIIIPSMMNSIIFRAAYQV